MVHAQTIERAVQYSSAFEFPATLAVLTDAPPTIHAGILPIPTHAHVPQPSPGLQPQFGCILTCTYTFSAVEPGPNMETITETAKNEHVGEHWPENKHMTSLP